MRHQLQLRFHGETAVSEPLHLRAEPVRERRQRTRDTHTPRPAHHPLPSSDHTIRRNNHAATRPGVCGPDQVGESTHRTSAPPSVAGARGRAAEATATRRNEHSAAVLLGPLGGRERESVGPRPALTGSAAASRREIRRPLRVRRCTTRRMHRTRPRTRIYVGGTEQPKMSYSPRAAPLAWGVFEYHTAGHRADVARVGDRG
jgi:hypothetical protein